MAGINRRPKFQTGEHAEWFEKTPKWVLYELVKDYAVQIDGDEAHGWDHWLEEVRERQGILRANGII